MMCVLNDFLKFYSPHGDFTKSYGH